MDRQISEKNTGDPWSWTTQAGPIALQGEQYELPNGEKGFWRSKLHETGIPMRTHTPQGDALVQAIQDKSPSRVQDALESFSQVPGNAAIRIATTLQYCYPERATETEDAHSKALSILHVLVNAEVNDKGSMAAEIKEIATKLLLAGADPAVRGNDSSAVSWAAEAGAFETLKAMLTYLKGKCIQVTGGSSSIGKQQQNVKYGGRGSDVFYHSVTSKNSRILPMVFELLEDELGEPNSYDRKSSLGRLLEISCIFRCTASLQFLLEQGASPEGVYFDKSDDWCDEARPLLLAASQGDPEAITCLLNYGASVNTRCVNGLHAVGGPLHLVCSGLTKDTREFDDRFESARRLIQAGCDVNGMSVMERRTPLQLAIQAGSCEMIRFLIVEALCSAEGTHESEARKHKKKSVGRTFHRSIEERHQNEGESRRVQLRLSVGEIEPEEMLDFPSNGEEWIGPDGLPIIDDCVVFHPRFGLCNGDEQLRTAEKLWGDYAIQTSDDDEDDASPSEGRAVVEATKELVLPLKLEHLQSETSSIWRPFWVFGNIWYSGPFAEEMSSSSRSRRVQPCGATGWVASDFRNHVKSVFTKVLAFTEERFETIITVEKLLPSELSKVLQMTTRSAAFKEFLTVVKETGGSDNVFKILINGGVVFPTMICCFVLGLKYPNLAGVYATSIEREN